jgi:hypothetical protein
MILILEVLGAWLLAGVITMVIYNAIKHAYTRSH